MAIQQLPPVYYVVKPEQVGREDIMTVLRRAVQKQFDGKEYYIAKETSVDKVTPYSEGKPRKLRGFAINENDTMGHLIYFDITELGQHAELSWLGNR
jgi:hypothetical protein